MKGHRFVAAALTLALGGCTVGKNYERPKVEMPPQYRSQTASGPRSLGDERWADVFVDEALRQLIATAIDKNLDVQIAASRIVQAGALLGITNADRLPTVVGQAAAQGQSGSIIDGDRLPTAGLVQLGVGLSWELDFWGRYRRASEAARADLLATEWGRRAVVTSLVGSVATLYYSLRALDLELEISRRTLTSREESLRLTDIRERGGATPLVDVRQAEQLVQAARGQIVDVQRRIEQTENAISVLLGDYPREIVRGRALVDQPRAPELPAGLPSTLIERRPDIQQAEQQMVASNARIGVARANYFPQISLTGSGGLASTSLSNLFTAGTWSVGAGLVQPLFNAGRTRSQVALAEARRQEAELVYRQSILQAFREVSDAIVGYRRHRELTESQQALVVAAQDARRLADIRYQGGATSYLEVLDSDTRLFTAELGLVQAQLAELEAFVEIYRALGGGWTS